MAQLKLPGMEARLGTHLGWFKLIGIWAVVQASEEAREMVSLAQSATATLGTEEQGGG